MLTKTDEKKRNFIEWFIESYDLKRNATVWVLNHITANDDLVKNLRFVEDASVYEVGMVVTAKGSEGVPFKFHNKQQTIEQEETVLYELEPEEFEQLNIFVQINFEGSDECEDYQDLLADKLEFSKEEDSYIDSITELTLIEGRRMILRNKINNSIKAQDKEEFKELSNNFKEVTKEYKELKLKIDSMNIDDLEKR